MTELFLIASIDGRGVAIETGQIDAAIDVGDCVAVPRVHPAIRGLAALRSRVATVVDTRQLLGLAPMAGTAGRAVTAHIDGHVYAFMVDALDDVALFERQPLTSGVALERGWREAGTGVIERDGEPLLVLDLAMLARTASALAA